MLAERLLVPDPAAELSRPSADGAVRAVLAPVAEVAKTPRCRLAPDSAGAEVARAAKTLGRDPGSCFAGGRGGER